MGGIIFVASLLASASAAQDWVEIETPHFVLLSNADPRTARNVALEFEQARAVLKSAISGDVDTALPIVIFALKESADLRVLLPDHRGELPSGFFLSAPDRHRIAVRLDEPPDQRYQVVYHEYHHLLFRSAFGRAPTWLVEGLAEFWSTMATGRGGQIEIGRPSPRHLRTLRLLPSVPLQQLLRLEGRVHDLPPERIASIYAQSWAVVHYLMLGKGADGRQRLERYTALVDSGSDYVDAFETVFGAVATLEDELAQYLDRTMFPAMRLDIPEPPPASEFRVRDLSTADVDAAIGTFLAFGPWPQHASVHLERALALDPESKAAMEGMGFLLYRQGELEAAEQMFDNVVNADATSYLAYYFLGLLTQKRMGSPVTVESSLSRAIELNPKFFPAYLALSVHVAEEEDRLEEALALAQEATRLAPDSRESWMNLADVLTRVNRLDEAHAARERAQALRD